MSVAERAYNRDVNNFAKRLKLPFRKIAEIMPVGFSDDDFVSTFQECYRYLWDEIVALKEHYDDLDVQRNIRHLKFLYSFPAPKAFLLYKAHGVIMNTRFLHQQGKSLSVEERAMAKQTLIEKNGARLEERSEKRYESTKYLQNTTPNEVTYFIDTYYKIKREHPEDVDALLRILQELSKYKCKETIVLMQKVNGCERNFKLRHFAFTTLQQQYGLQHTHLKRNRKHKVADSLVAEVINDPAGLLDQIYNDQYGVEAHKQFDIFLSHSSEDYKLLLKLKDLLNNSGLTVYIDWVEDKGELKRELASEDTAKVLVERIKNSKAILLVQTVASTASVWTPWELGYAQAIGKKICVLPLKEVENAPAYLDIYDKAFLDGNEIMVNAGGDNITITEWIEN